jgi:chorismate mutase
MERLDDTGAAVAVRAVRGAVQLTTDTSAEMADAVTELLTTMLNRNELGTDDLISVLLTATPDLVSDFPAAAARTLGIGDVPLLCAQEIDVTGAPPRIVRVMAHVETARARVDIVHCYLRGAEVLRRDLAQ